MLLESHRAEWEIKTGIKQLFDWCFVSGCSSSQSSESSKKQKGEETTKVSTAAAETTGNGSQTGGQRAGCYGGSIINM